MIRYLQGVTALVAAFGAALALVPALGDALFGWMIFGSPGLPDNPSDRVADYVRFAYAVLGATILGWFVLIGWVVHRLGETGDPATWRALVASLASWFVLDTTISVVGGYWPNAVFNTIVVAAYLPGLVATRRRPTTRPHPAAATG